jgi:hypothetical protein
LRFGNDAEAWLRCGMFVGLALEAEVLRISKN